MNSVKVRCSFNDRQNELNCLQISGELIFFMTLWFKLTYSWVNCCMFKLIFIVAWLCLRIGFSYKITVIHFWMWFYRKSVRLIYILSLWRLIMLLWLSLLHKNHFINENVLNICVLKVFCFTVTKHSTSLSTHDRELISNIKLFFVDKYIEKKMP